MECDPDHSFAVFLMRNVGGERTVTGQIAWIGVFCPPCKHPTAAARHVEAPASEGVMLNEPDLLWLIDRIYEGAVTSYGWAGLLRELAEAFRSETANIATVCLSTGRPRAISFAGIEPGYQGSYSALAGLVTLSSVAAMRAAFARLRPRRQPHHAMPQTPRRESGGACGRW